jgi:hypothetical protein
MRVSRESTLLKTEKKLFQDNYKQQNKKKNLASSDVRTRHMTSSEGR